MRMTRHRALRHARWVSVLALLLVATACGSDPAPSTTTDSGSSATDEAGTDQTATDEAATQAAGGTLTVASTDFTENEIVARMYALALTQAGFTVEESYQLGARAVVLPELESGGIDIYPEYAGTALEELNGGAGEATADTEATLGLLRTQFEELGVTVLEPAEAEDKNTLVVTAETAEELGLASTSDLAEAGELTLGGPPECPERPLCQPGYEETYGFTFAEFVPLDAGGPLTVDALANGDIDVALLFSTDGIIAENGWVSLEDDQGLQPAENLVPVVRTAVLTPEIEEALNAVSAVLTTEALTELNRRVNADAEDPETVAEEFLTEQGVLTG